MDKLIFKILTEAIAPFAMQIIKLLEEIRDQRAPTAAFPTVVKDSTATTGALPPAKPVDPIAAIVAPAEPIVNTSPVTAGQAPAVPVTFVPQPTAGVTFIPQPVAAPQGEMTGEEVRAMYIIAMKAIAEGRKDVITMILERVKTALKKGESLPTDERGLLGKALMEIAKEDINKGRAVLRQVDANLLGDVPAALYPKLAGIIEAGLKAPVTESLL